MAFKPRRWLHRRADELPAEVTAYCNSVRGRRALKHPAVPAVLSALLRSLAKVVSGERCAFIDLLPSP